MDVTASRLAFLAGAGSLVILLAAFGFQHIGELALQVVPLAKISAWCDNLFSGDIFARKTPLTALAWRLGIAEHSSNCRLS